MNPRSHGAAAGLGALGMFLLMTWTNVAPAPIPVPSPPSVEAIAPPSLEQQDGDAVRSPPRSGELSEGVTPTIEPSGTRVAGTLEEELRRLSERVGPAYQPSAVKEGLPAKLAECGFAPDTYVLDCDEFPCALAMLAHHELHGSALAHYYECVSAHYQLGQVEIGLDPGEVASMAVVPGDGLTARDYEVVGANMALRRSMLREMLLEE